MPDKMLRVRAVMERTGMPRTTLYRQIRKGQFPQSVRITENSVGWRESEVDDWIDRVCAEPRMVEQA